MKAKEVWDVWRRILRDSTLCENLFNEDFPKRAESLGLTPEETQIALAYAATPKETQWFITNYRYRLISSVGYALETCAPLTRYILITSGYDIKDLAIRYLDVTGWQDDGPFVYRAGARILNYLLESVAETVVGLKDIISLESASIELISNLARTPHLLRVDSRKQEAIVQDLSQWRFQLTGTGVIVTTKHTLTPWLKDRSTIGKLPLKEKPQHFLVYLPSLTASYKLAGVSTVGKVLFQLLDFPRPLAELEPHPLLLETIGSDSCIDMLHRFLKLGVVQGVPKLS